MAAKRRKVALDIVDAPRPKVEGGSISFRSPIPLVFKGKVQLDVKLGLKADAPVILFGATHLEKAGIKLLNAGPVDAGTELVARFEYTAGANSEPFFLEQGEVLVKGVILESDVEVE